MRTWKPEWKPFIPGTPVPLWRPFLVYGRSGLFPFGYILFARWNGDAWIQISDIEASHESSYELHCVTHYAAYSFEPPEVTANDPH